MTELDGKSLDLLEKVDPRLSSVVVAVSKKTPIKITCGFRDKKEQDEAFLGGKSKTPWPESKHNKVPSLAIDFVPVYNGKLYWGNNTKELLQIGYVARILIEEGERQGVDLRWGGDWNENDQTGDTSFVDAYHIEIKG